jgi:hypothetical protein
MGKKLLCVNIPAIGDANMTKELLRFLFREAKIHDAIIFFGLNCLALNELNYVTDECEGLFESRNQKASPVAALLTEIEQYDSLIIMATNRAYGML